ncbi:MAG: PIN domain-containing protein [Muribaculaceae bacterium]|nr:PIN domain-containing protein [Muribaculaceae bacterium]
MKNIFLDTNFIIDYFVREDFNGEAEKLLELGAGQNLKFFISYLSVANFAYIMRKMPQEQLMEIIFRICSLFHVVNNTRDQILRNLKSGFKDFEDGLQYQCAIAAKCDCIITRNKRDFVNLEIPVMSAGEFLDSTQK